MKDQVLDEQYLNSVIHVLTEFKRACDSSGIYDGGAVWLFKRFINGPALAAIKARLPLSSNDAKRHKGTIMTYTVFVKNLLRQYATCIVIARADGNIQSFKEGLLMAGEFSPTLRVLAILYSVVYNK